VSLTPCEISIVSITVSDVAAPPPPPPPQTNSAPAPYEYMNPNQPDYFDQMNGINQDDLEVNLTDEDKLYLRLKWGKTYRPEEWV
jgi:hypothetical protein